MTEYLCAEAAASASAAAVSLKGCRHAQSHVRDAPEHYRHKHPSGQQHYSSEQQPFAQAHISSNGKKRPSQRQSPRPPLNACFSSKHLRARYPDERPNALAMLHVYESLRESMPPCRRIRTVY
ncbi:hypothetical protein D3C78_758420 [compost metagenome]